MEGFKEACERKALTALASGHQQHRVTVTVGMAFIPAGTTVPDRAFAYWRPLHAILVDERAAPVLLAANPVGMSELLATPSIPVGIAGPHIGAAWRYKWRWDGLLF